jgi:hypothetical protein
MELGERVVCDTELNDLIKYCEIEYEIISGHIWPNGSKTTAKSWVDDLYAKRKTDPDHNLVYKLMLNSIYGKTLQKSTQTWKKPKQFETKQQMAAYIRTHHQIVNEIDESTNEVLTSTCVDYGYNNAPYGVTIQAAAPTK